MIKDAITRIQEYLQSHGASYTLKRLGQKAAQQFLGTYERRRKQEAATPEELRAQRENQPDAGLISVVIPVYNTDPGMLTALLDSLEAQTYLNFEAILYDGASTRAETAAVLKARSEKEPRFRLVRGKRIRASAATATRPSGWPGANTLPCATTTTCWRRTPCGGWRNALRRSIRIWSIRTRTG